MSLKQMKVYTHGVRRLPNKLQIRWNPGTMFESNNVLSFSESKAANEIFVAHYWGDKLCIIEQNHRIMGLGLDFPCEKAGGIFSFSPVLH